MTTIQQGNYGAMIHEQDGEFQVYFLYNMRCGDNDVYGRKTYKTLKTAERKVAEYIKKQAS